MSAAIHGSAGFQASAPDQRRGAPASDVAELDRLTGIVMTTFDEPAVGRQVHLAVNMDDTATGDHLSRDEMALPDLFDETGEDRHLASRPRDRCQRGGVECGRDAIEIGYRHIVRQGQLGKDENIHTAVTCAVDRCHMQRKVGRGVASDTLDLGDGESEAGHGDVSALFVDVGETGGRNPPVQALAQFNAKRPD